MKLKKLITVAAAVALFFNSNFVNAQSWTAGTGLLWANPTSTKIGIGTSTPNAPLQFATNTASRKIVLYEGANNDHQFYGFGVNGGVLRYQVYSTGDNHVFYTGVSSTTSSELMRIQGDGKVGIGITPLSRFHVNNGAILADGATGGTPTSGAGRRLMWIPAKYAFRAGYIDGTQWDDANIGLSSIAFGYNTTASGNYTTAMGWGTTASGGYSTAMGRGTTAFGIYSTAMGFNTAAMGPNSTAMGYISTASGNYSIAMGSNSTASGHYSTSLGNHITSAGLQNFVLGVGVDNTNRLINNTDNSLMVGFNSTIPTLFVGPSSGVGTTGTVAIATTTIPSAAPTGGYKFVVAGNSNINGSLVIGDPAGITSITPFSSDYKLFVASGLLAEKVKVAIKTTSDWSDYVFANGYKLRSLESVEAFIKENKHLPDVPSAEEVVNNGIDVAKMDALLLQKIEELTLYMIEMKKENEILKKEVSQLKIQIQE